MSVTNLKEFESALREELSEQVERVEQDTVFESAQFMIQRLTELTNDFDAVLTGAYRVSHHIEDESGRVLYTHIERPPPDQEFEPVLLFSDPDIGDVIPQLQLTYEGGTLVFVNGRFYDHIVEDNYGIYDIAGDALAAKLGT